jgi:hypothetical protein
MIIRVRPIIVAAIPATIANWLKLRTLGWLCWRASADGMVETDPDELKASAAVLTSKAILKFCASYCPINNLVT